jgi:hypothetical protein
MTEHDNKKMQLRMDGQLQIISWSLATFIQACHLNQYKEGSTTEFTTLQNT